MKYWSYVEPAAPGLHVIVTLSEADILATYYPYWRGLMRRAGKAALISEANCIEDWVVVHWAEPALDGADRPQRVVRRDDEPQRPPDGDERQL